MGHKIETAIEQVRCEAEHHTRLAQARGDVFENGFAQGFVEALHILQNVAQGA